uniref:Putative secreted protein n=1 Tax=Anopheles darlingi TaxID=43151 RepID=A0A2M4D8X5_ANODA
MKALSLSLFCLVNARREPLANSDEWAHKKEGTRDRNFDKGMRRRRDRVCRLTAAGFDLSVRRSAFALALCLYNFCCRVPFNRAGRALHRTPLQSRSLDRAFTPTGSSVPYP